LSIYDAAVAYRAEDVPLVIVAGAEYGSGSSRDWAAKGTMLLGVKAVLATSFERIHRSNLIDMAVLPLQFPRGESAQSLGLTGEERYSIIGLHDADPVPTEVIVRVAHNGQTREITMTVRIDTPAEAEYFVHGGILQYVLRQLVNS
jgi:aconitate hydratase